MTRLLILLALIPSFAQAHDSWISKGGLRNGVGEWCCGEGDCFVMKGVQTQRDGYFVPSIPNGINAEAVPFSQSQPSPDGQFWRCKRPDGTRRCFFAPPPGS